MNHSFIRDQLEAMCDRPVDHTLSLLLLGYEDWRAEETYWRLQYKTEKRFADTIDLGGEG